MASAWLVGAPIDCLDSGAIVESNQGRPRDTLEVRGDRFIQEVEDRNTVVRTSRDRGPNAFQPALPSFTTRALGDASVNHYESNGLFGQVIRRFDSRRRHKS